MGRIGYCGHKRPIWAGSKSSETSTADHHFTAYVSRHRGVKACGVFIRNCALGVNPPSSPSVKKSHIPKSGRNIKGRPFWSRVWVLAQSLQERNALNE